MTTMARVCPKCGGDFFHDDGEYYTCAYCGHEPYDSPLNPRRIWFSGEDEKGGAHQSTFRRGWWHYRDDQYHIVVEFFVDDRRNRAYAQEIWAWPYKNEALVVMAVRAAFKKRFKKTLEQIMDVVATSPTRKHRCQAHCIGRDDKRTLTATIELGYLPPEQLRGNSRANRYEKARWAKKVRESGNWWGYIEGAEFIRHKPDVVKVTYTFRNQQKVDLDNLIIGMKPFLDGLVDAGVLVDDSPDHCVFGEPKFVKWNSNTSGADNRTNKTIITLEEWHDDDDLTCQHCDAEFEEPIEGPCPLCGHDELEDAE